MWARIIAVAAGIWLMAAPAVLHYSGAPQIDSRIVGPIVAAVAIIAMSEVTRSVRWLHLPLGLWLVIAPGLIGYLSTAPRWNNVGVGALVLALAFVGGKHKHRFGGGWRSLWQPYESEEATR